MADKAKKKYRERRHLGGFGGNTEIRVIECDPEKAPNGAEEVAHGTLTHDWKQE